MKIHEYQAKALLREFGVPMLKVRMADNFDPIVWLLRKFRGTKKKTPA